MWAVCVTAAAFRCFVVRTSFVLLTCWNYGYKTVFANRAVDGGCYEARPRAIEVVARVVWGRRWGVAVDEDGSVRGGIGGAVVGASHPIDSPRRLD